jgi:hypothetical protein
MSQPGVPGLADGALAAQIIAGLEQTIWRPEAGVRDYDRVEATQLLGQFSHPAAGVALRRLVRDGARRLQPAPDGRLLRDTALDTLLRSPAQRTPATRLFLTRYYSFGRRLARLRLERNIVYDDIPILMRQGQLGLLLRAYVAPLVALLILLPLAAEALGGANGPLAAAGLRSNGLVAALGLLALFGGLGLVVFNLHQVALVALVATWGRRLGLPRLGGPASKAALASGLAVVTLGLSLFALARALAMGGLGFSPGDLRVVTVCLILLPLLALPCYMLAHDLEVAETDETPDGPAVGRWAPRLATALRWVSALIYIIFLLAAFGLVYFPLAVARADAPSDLEVFARMAPWVGYLLLAPVPTLALLALWGYAQRALAGGGRAATL